MLAIRGDSDWIQGLVWIVIIGMSALGSLAKWLVAKAKERKEAARLEEEEGRSLRPSPRQPGAERLRPPVARPMPPRRRPAPPPMVRTIPPPTVRPAPRPPVSRQVVSRQIELDVPDSVKPLVQMLFGGAVEEDEGVVGRPAPPLRPAATRPKRPVSTPQPDSPRTRVGDQPSMEEIDRREEREARLAAQRIGHVETHIAASADAAARGPTSVWLDSADRPSLRRAIVLNEILGPPVSLRSPDSF